MKKLLCLGLLLAFLLAASTQVYADPGAAVTISSVTVSADRQWIEVAVSVGSKPNNVLSGQIMLTLDSSILTQNGIREFNSQSATVSVNGYVQYTFQVPFQGVGHYKFVAHAYAYPSMQLLGTAVTDPPAVGDR